MHANPRVKCLLRVNDLGPTHSPPPPLFLSKKSPAVPSPVVLSPVFLSFSLSPLCSSPRWRAARQRSPSG
jgi:hypothetical protein